MAKYARRVAWMAVLVASAFFSLRPATANPGCSLGDLGKAFKDTFTNIPLSCAPQAADPIFYPLLGYIIALLQTPQGVEFCSAAESVQASASDAQKQIAGYWNKLLPDQQSKLTEYVPGFADLSSGASDVSGAISIVSCACKTAQWKGPGDIASDIGACTADALCAADNWLHDNIWSGFADCTNGPPPHKPSLVDCRPDPKKLKPEGGGWYWDDSVPFVGAPNNCDAAPSKNYSGDQGFTCQGSVCLSSGNGDFCYCPPVMQNWDQAGIDYNGDCIGYISCHCPIGSQPLSDDPKQAASYICVCPDTGLLVNDDGSCPLPPPKCEPSCPAGQISKISDKKTCSYSCGCPDGLTKAGDKCVTPCADASQVMLGSGECCATTQANSCGTCCPTGMKPDASGLSCVSALPPHKGGITPLRPTKQLQK